MRILGYSKKWEKLQKPVHTTFRYPRKDKDWHEGEIVQEVYKPRSKEREFIQVAKIIYKEAKVINELTEDEAIEDGFSSAFEMWIYLGKPNMKTPINKLTLEVEKV